METLARHVRYKGFHILVTSATAVKELTGVKTLASDEVFFLSTEFIRVPEGDLEEGSAPSWVVHDVLDNSLDIAFALGEVQSTEACWGNSVELVRPEATLRCAFSLC